MRPNENPEIIVHKYISFKGKDGKEYTTYEDTIAANQTHDRQFLRYKGVDGKEYSDVRDLQVANDAYWDAQKIDISILMVNVPIDTSKHRIDVLIPINIDNTPIPKLDDLK